MTALAWNVPASAKTQTAYNATTSPGGVTALAAITVNVAGYYQVDVYAYFSGTVTAATEADNIQLWVDGLAYQNLLVPGVVNGTPVRHSFLVKSAGTGLTIETVCVGAATTGAIYHSLVAITQVN